MSFFQSQFFVPLTSLLFAVFIWVVSCVVYRSKKGNQTNRFEKFITHILHPYIRSIVYAAGLIWATYLYTRVAQSGPSMTGSLAVLMREFALTGLYLLFGTLIPGLLSVYFPNFPLNALFIRARRSLGISGFFFGASHGLIGFFYNLSASVLAPLFLPFRYQIALFCSFIAFCILALMAISSIDRIERWMGSVKWKRLHRFVYWAIILIVIHAFLIGSHFTIPTSIIPKITNSIALTLLLLEVGATLLRFWQQKRLGTVKNISISVALILLVIVGFWTTFSIFQKPYDPHSAHRKGYSTNYSVEVVTDPAVIVPNQQITAHITVRDKRNRKIVKKFQIVQEKLMHLVVIGRDLSTYQHIHPEQQPDGTFVVTFMLPKEGAYTLYFGYSPPDYLENLSIVTLKTQNAPSTEQAALVVDGQTKKVRDLQISLIPTGVISRTSTVDFSYTFTDMQGKPASNIQSYLGAFGHLAIVSEDSKTYLHVHPIDVPIAISQLGGPVVRFSTFFQQKGKYKLFGQFKQNDETFVVEHVIEVK